MVKKRSLFMVACLLLVATTFLIPESFHKMSSVINGLEYGFPFRYLTVWSTNDRISLIYNILNNKGITINPALMGLDLVIFYFLLKKITKLTNKYAK